MDDAKTMDANKRATEEKNARDARSTDTRHDSSKEHESKAPEAVQAH